jgi:hypothetical protein
MDLFLEHFADLAKSSTKVKIVVNAGIICIWYQSKWAEVDNMEIKKHIHKRVLEFSVNYDNLELKMNDGSIIRAGIVDKVTRIESDIIGILEFNSNNKVPAKFANLNNAFYKLNNIYFDNDFNELYHTQSSDIFYIKDVKITKQMGNVIIVNYKYVFTNARVENNAIFVDDGIYYLTSSACFIDCKTRYFTYFSICLLSNFILPYTIDGKKIVFQNGYIIAKFKKPVSHLYLVGSVYFIEDITNRFREVFPCRLTRATHTKAAIRQAEPD